MMANPMYALLDVTGKGKGLVAMEDIPKGTRILSEEPIITVLREQPDNEQIRANICQQVLSLREDQREAFLSMHNIHPYTDDSKRYFGIVRTNALPIGPEGSEAGIFLEACRINHACDNNAQKNWNENIKRHTVHALRDIHAGDEITIYYLGVLNNCESRRKALQKGFGFTCSCSMCCLPQKLSRKNDERLDAILRLDGLIGQGGLWAIVTSPLRILRYIEQQIWFYNEQGSGDIGLPRAFLDAAQVAIANSDLARGSLFVEKALSGWRIALGGDSTAVMENDVFARDPTKHPVYGLSTKWKTAVDEIPSGLDPRDLEDWLWKRNKPQRPGQLADLRSQHTFPGFSDLPGEDGADLNFYDSRDMVNYQPRRHWCFLGEIMDFMTLHHLQIDTKDVCGKKVSVHLYTDRRGSELSPAQVQEGYTVAVLYAQRRIFKHDEPGIRHEKSSMMKIFPVSLQNLLALNDRVQEYSTKSDGIRTCHGCGKKEISLQKCRKCMSFWYCGKACQVLGWNEKGHKADCKLLKDADMRGMFHLNWDKFNSQVQFPLPNVTDAQENE